MPPRLTNLARARPCLHRGLATSRVLCQVHDMARRNHYERLDVRQDASAADIKK